MTGDEGLFASLDHYDNPTEIIIYGENGQGDVVGLGKVAISTTNSIEDVYHVQGLGYNLLSVSQLCEKGYNCIFTHEGVTSLEGRIPLLSLQVIYGENFTMWISQK
jgi:hypothetical protein